jgi:hypothetical protein
VLCTSIPVHAELSQDGELITSFDSTLSPTRLPRKDAVPIAVTVSGNVKNAHAENDKIPQLRTISVGINSAGELFDKGLPTCRIRTIQPATERQARKVCGKAIIGTGQVTVLVRFPAQPTFVLKGSLLAFNGPNHHGKKLILAQIYSSNPPSAFVLPFTVIRTGGLFGTVMRTELPPSAQGWAYLTHFDMTLDRQYRYRGKSRSYVSAACAAPSGWHGAIFPFARATYGFGNGQKLTTTVTRTCQVR